MADEKSVKSDADPVMKFQETLDNFMGVVLTRIEKLETRADDSFSGKDGKPVSDGGGFDNLDKALKGFTDRLDSFSKRMDAFEGKGEEKKEEGGDGKVEVEVKPAEEKEEKKDPVPPETEPAEMAADKKSDGQEEGADGKVHPETEKGALSKEREENNLKANDSARADSDEQISALKAQIARLESLIPKVLSDDDNAKFAAAQARANATYHAFGDANGAPRWANGETYGAYLRRLVKPFKAHSKVWKEKDLSTMTVDVLEAVAEQVYSDAGTASRAIEVVGEGMLREVHEIQPVSGRRITRFVGDPEACWGQFKTQPRIITGIQTKF